MAGFYLKDSDLNGLEYSLDDGIVKYISLVILIMYIQGWEPLV